MLLVHDIAANQTTIIINDDCTIAAVADRTDHSLWNTLCIVGITKLIEQLLLLVIADYTLVGDGTPEVLMSVDEHHRRDGFDTHASKSLFHITLEGFRLGVIYTVARRGLDEQVTVEHLLDGVDVTVVKR